MSFVTTLEAFAAAIPASGALLGLDPGTRTIGVAVCDERRSLASPLETVFRERLMADMERLRLHAQRRRVCGIVLGMPFNMDGTAGRRAQSVRAFSRHVEDALGLPVLHWDERLSTSTAQDALRDAGVKRDAIAGKIDSHAAAEILQSALDRLANLDAKA